MKIAASGELASRLFNRRQVVSLDSADFTGVTAVVITVADSRSGTLALLKRTGFHIPMFLFAESGVDLSMGVNAVIRGQAQGWLELEPVACQYEGSLLSSFYDTLTQYVEIGNSTFACPGHQHGEFFKKHPTERHFYRFFGENLLHVSMYDADVKLGDPLVYGGSAKHTQKFVAKVFHAGKTYFVLDGTPAANKVVTNALLTRNDLVLFDRNNHRPSHHGALIQAGAMPVYLKTAHNPFGPTGSIGEHCFDEEHLCQQFHGVAPQKTDQPHPFRLTIIQLSTYDGTIYNTRQVIGKIDRLCDYILFDSTWIGYEQFIPMMTDGSPLLLDLDVNDPGILVTRSVHKQQAGFSQTSQIHKKGNHIRSRTWLRPYKHLNNAFMLHASTSPFYPLFAALSINAKIHEGESGRRLWAEYVRPGIEARKAILTRYKTTQPFIPPVIDGKPWKSYPTQVIASERRFFNFEPDTKWHGFSGYARNQYFVDPCKLLLTTPGIDAQTGQYTEFGIPATILAYYLRENGVVPEKCDLNSILFLLTPAESAEKLAQLVTMLAQFEQHIEDDTPLANVLPTTFNRYPVRYRDYTLRELCQEMHSLYVSFDVKDLQKMMFRQESLLAVAMSPQDANSAFIRGNAELVRISEATSHIAAESTLPYPPGVLCVVPGEVWGGTVQQYFLALEEDVNLLPDFSPELQGVYSETDADGIKRLYGCVVK